MRHTGVIIWLETTTGVETIRHKLHVLCVCSCICTYYCDINLLNVSAHFQLAVMKPEKGMGDIFVFRNVIYQLTSVCRLT
jgi:hypothetical protein